MNAGEELSSSPRLGRLDSVACHPCTSHTRTGSRHMSHLEQRGPRAARSNPKRSWLSSAGIPGAWCLQWSSCCSPAAVYLRRSIQPPRLRLARGRQVPVRPPDHLGDRLHAAAHRLLDDHRDPARCAARGHAAVPEPRREGGLLGVPVDLPRHPGLRAAHVLGARARRLQDHHASAFRSRRPSSPSPRRTSSRTSRSRSSASP